MLLDLDEIDTAARRLRLFSRNRFNLYSFRDADYGDRTGRSLRLQVEERLHAVGVVAGGGAIRLLTMPRILGYAFNPLSVFYCYDERGALTAVLYEVHNTFGEIHTYVVAVDSETPEMTQEAQKVFHVSPFMGLEMRYAFRVSPPEERVLVAIEGHDAEGGVISTSLSGARRALSDRSLLGLLFSHPLLTLKVTLAIHWHALRLLFKRIPTWPHPPSPQTPVSAGRIRRP